MDDINYHANTGDYYTNPGIHIFHGDTNIKDNLVVEGTIKDGDGVAYLKSTEKAADSDKLDGLDSTDFAAAGHDHDSDYLGITAKAADSDKLDGLDSTDFGRPVFLTTQLTSTAWDGDAFSTTSKTLIDLSTVFGAPAGIKAVLCNVAIKDSASAANDCFLCLSPNASALSGPKVACSGLANSKYGYGEVVVPCDANGDIYYQIAASGSGTATIFLEIWGYWL
jgi:hypothetical protein